MKTPDPKTKIMTLEQLLARRADWRRQGRVVVWTNGCFDVLHVGHIRNLQAVAQQGDVVVVGVNSDASVQRLKGPTRPLNGQDERAELLAALACVDCVLIFDDDTPIPVLTRLQPEIHCKGAEYAPPQGKPVPEAETVQAYGGEVRYMPQIPNRSTTELIQKMSATQKVIGACGVSIGASAPSMGDVTGACGASKGAAAPSLKTIDALPALMSATDAAQPPMTSLPTSLCT